MSGKLCSFRLIILSILFHFGSPAAFAQTETSWTEVGNTFNTSNVPNYFKIVQVNNNADKYSTIIDVAVEGDPGVFTGQGSFNIRVDKQAGTAGRFDGVEVRCTSGNPLAAIFYIYNNAIWVKAGAGGGKIFYKAVNFSAASPLGTAPYGVTTAIAGYTAVAEKYGLKCDFNDNRFYYLPYTDVEGSININNRLTVGSEKKTGIVSINGNNKRDDFIWISKDSTSTQPDFYSSYNGTENLQYGVIAYGVRPYSKAWQIYEKGKNSEWTNLMHVGIDGNVGIGTDKPLSRLSVNGTIQATRMRVITAAAAWPDYVFSKGYTLPSLQEVEQYVTTYHHLPGIPDATAIQRDGHDLADIDARLLQKVEELTLYIIDLEKRLKKVEQR